MTILPKAHLHVHLESTIRPATVRELGGPAEPDRPFQSFREFAEVTFTGLRDEIAAKTGGVRLSRAG